MKKQLLIDCKFFSWYDFSEHCFLLGIYVFLKILFPQDITFASVDCFFLWKSLYNRMFFKISK